MAFATLDQYGPGTPFANSLPGTFASYQNNPDVVAYLKALQAQQQQQQAPAVANSAQLPQPSNSVDTTPFDQQYASAMNYASLGLGSSLAGIEAQKPTIRAQFGYLDTGALDPNNPFGQAQLLKRSYDQSKTGNTNRYAARGQLYSGALQNAQNEAQFGYQANDANLRNAYQQQLAQLEQQKASAYGNYYMGAAQAGQNHTQALIDSRPVDYGSPAPQQQAAAPVVNDVPGITDAQYATRYGPGSAYQTGWENAFRATHGGLSIAEYNYLQALYKAQNGG